MKKITFSWGIVAVVAFFLCIIVLSFSSSLWFLHALLGSSPGQHTIGYYQSFLRVSPYIQSIREKNAAFLPGVSDDFNRFVYKKDERGEYIVGIPKVLRQFSLPDELQRESWEVRRIGWILLARHTEAPSGVQKQSYSLTRAISKTFVAVFLKGLPMHVRLILQIDGPLDSSNALYVEKKSTGHHVVVHNRSSEFLGSQANRIQKNTGDPSMTIVSLQSDTLPKIPSGFATVVENKVSEMMRFTKTRPKILESLLSINKTVILYIKGSSIAIGIPKSEDTSAMLIHEWMHTEQGTRHPEKKAFVLPDKTIGYEYIPGNSTAHFSPIKSSNNCLPSEEYDERLFLCGRDKILVLANEESIGSYLVASFTDTPIVQHGIIQGHVLEAIGLASLAEKVEYAISDEMLEFWVDAKIK